MHLALVALVLILSTLTVKYGLEKLATTSRFQLFGELITRVSTTEKVVALTYDDGPHPPYTNQILDVLERFQVKATFFVVGKKIQENPEVVTKILLLGHELGNHSFSHAPMVSQRIAFIKSEIKKTDRLLKNLGVQTNPHFRSPFGFKRIRLPWVLAQMRKKNVLWDVDPRDYAASDPDSVVEKVVGQIQPGSIVLLHDGSHEDNTDRTLTVTATERLIRQLQRQGYQFKTVSELLSLQ